jgi:predicted ATPase
MAVLLEMIAGNPTRVRAHFESYIGLARAGDMKMWLTAYLRGEVYIRWHFGDRTDCLVQYRRGAAAWRELGFRLYDPLFDSIQAEIEAASGELANALATLERAIAESKETGQHWYDAELHRIRGEILVKQNPVDPAAVEAALLAAIAVAQQQKARSFELRAALSLAKLYRSTDRVIEVQNILGPALEGFSPTPQFPEVAEALSVLASIRPSVPV